MPTRTTERKHFLHDIFVTALEGGIGYWSLCREYHWMLPDGEDLPIREACDLDGFYAVVTDENDETESIDINVIAKGVNRIINARFVAGDRHLVCEEIPGLGAWVAPKVREASRENDSSDIDADLADIIVQVGLFDEVVYG